MSVNVRMVDTAQYENRLRQWDFDIVIANWGESLSPGNEQRGYWGSAAADQPGSRNLVGIKNPAVDTLIDRVIYAKDRDELVAATQGARPRAAVEFLRRAAMDLRQVRTARWDRFGRPADDAEIRAGGLPDHLVVGRGQGGQGAARRLPLVGEVPSDEVSEAAGRLEVDRLSDYPARAAQAALAPSPRGRRALARRNVLVLAAGVAARSASPARAKRRTPRHVRLRRSRAAGGFHAFRLRQSGRAEGRPCSRRSAPTGSSTRIFLTFNSLNSYILKGDAALGHGAHLRHADGALGRRAGRHVWARRARRAHLRRRADLSFLLRPEAKFHDGSALTAHDVAWSLATLKDKGHPIITQLLRDLQKRARPPTTAPSSCASPPKRARDVPLFVAGLPIFSRPIMRSGRSTSRRSTSRSAAAPTRSASSTSAASSNIERVKDWWGADLPVAKGQNNFDVIRYRILPRPRRRLRRLHRRQLSVPRGIHLAHLGDALRLSRLQGRPRQAQRTPRRHAVRRAGLVHQHAARASSRTAACARR